MLKTKLNDEFRRTGAGGRIMVTPGIAAMPLPEQLAILSAVQSFNAYAAENDPHGEHDFGIIKHHGESVYFKIDYYDNALQCGSEDPADPLQTTRVLTIMLAFGWPALGQQIGTFVKRLRVALA